MLFLWILLIAQKPWGGRVIPYLTHIFFTITSLTFNFLPTFTIENFHTSFFNFSLLGQCRFSSGFLVFLFVPFFKNMASILYPKSLKDFFTGIDPIFRKSSYHQNLVAEFGNSHLILVVLLLIINLCFIYIKLYQH